jgi:hypothetical protein
MTEPRTIELGLDTFGDVPRDDTDRLVTPAQALRNVVAEGVLADSWCVGMIRV